MIKKILKLVGYIFTILIFLIGLFIFVYPLLNNYTLNRNTEEAIEKFHYLKNIASQQNVSDYRPENNSSVVEDTHKFDKLYEDMKKYNEDIFKNGQSELKDAWSYEQSAFDLSEYGISDSIIGEIRIPKMDVELPIYLGATSYNMSMGATQLGQTSMPVGGENTNCVIAGHRGSSGGRFFLDIEMLEIGDKIYIDNLWETLTYRVSKIDIIDPNDIDKILIQKGKDMVTLTTCHPYPYMTQRYIVYCERVPNDTSEQNSNSNNVDNEITTDSSDSSTEITTEIISESQSKNIKIKNSGSQLFMVFEKLLYVLVSVLLIVLAIFLFRKNRGRTKVKSAK